MREREREGGTYKRSDRDRQIISTSINITFEKETKGSDKLNQNNLKSILKMM